MAMAMAKKKKSFRQNKSVKIKTNISNKIY